LGEVVATDNGLIVAARVYGKRFPYTAAMNPSFWREFAAEFGEVIPDDVEPRVGSRGYATRCEFVTEPNEPQVSVACWRPHRREVEINCSSLVDWAEHHRGDFLA
jgi:hypothetical protein